MSKLRKPHKSPRVAPGRAGETGYVRRLLLISFLLVLVILGGTLGYLVVEGWTVDESLYMVIITVSTVGYSEVRPLSAGGRVLTSGLIVSGVALAAYLVGTLTQMIVEGKLRFLLGRSMMENKIRKLKGHIVVCGFGQVGKVLCRELADSNRTFVVVEEREEPAMEAQAQEYLLVRGNATEETVLRAAGVGHADGLVSSISCDADNVFITLEAREINEKVFIVSRAVSPRNVRHLQKAGADRVISPDVDGGHRMAQAVIRSAVHEFFDLTHRRSAMELLIDEVSVRENCRWTGKSIKDADIRGRTGLIIVAIKRGEEEMIFNPPADTVIQGGDVFVTLGFGQHQEMFEKMMTS